jgi:hypothetical protein
MKTATQELFEVVYQWGRVGVVTDHNAPTYRELLQRAVAELDAAPQNFYEQAPVCAADNELIDDLEHAFESPDGKLYHSRDCASDDALIADALCVIEVGK